MSICLEKAAFNEEGNASTDWERKNSKAKITSKICLSMNGILIAKTDNESGILITR